MKISGSVVIVTHNSADTIGECLSYLAQSDEARAFLTIVVDNCSVDNTTVFIEQEFPWVRLIKSLDNGGFGAANNQGIAIAEGEWIIFLNPDASIDPISIAALVEQMQADKSIGIISPAILDAEGNITMSYFPFLNFWTSTWIAFGIQKMIPLTKSEGKWSVGTKPTDKFAEVDRVIGAVMLINRKILQEVGEFDTRYFLFSEEEDLCFRFKLAGWKVVYSPNVKSRHIGGTTMQGTVALSMAAANWSRYLFLKKFHGELVAELSRGIWILALLFRLIGILILPTKTGNLKAVRVGYLESIRSLIYPGYFDRNLRPKRQDSKNSEQST